LLYHDVKRHQNDYQSLISLEHLQEIKSASNNFSNGTNPKVTEVLLKAFGSLWKDRCERTLYLAKQLGNIYTGSLYNGLISLVCDKDVNLVGKKIFMFSYGSGCAASMFIIKVVGDYSWLQQKTSF
jgi:hydroxymethylglutaryl-CoA synthase